MVVLPAVISMFYGLWWPGSLTDSQHKIGLRSVLKINGFFTRWSSPSHSSIQAEMTNWTTESSVRWSDRRNKTPGTKKQTIFIFQLLLFKCLALWKILTSSALAVKFSKTHHINFALLFLSSLWSDLSVWGHYLIVLNLRNPNLRSACATERGNAR